MYFQVLDEKYDCVGVYLDEKIYYDKIPDGLSKTWRYVKFLEDDSYSVEYANLYCGKKTLMQVCPEDLKNRLDGIMKRLKAFFVSFKHAKVSLYDNCFYDLVPERFLLEYCYLKNEITKHVLENYDKPKNYDFLADLSKVVEDIRHERLNIDVATLDSKLGSEKTRNFVKKLSRIDHHIDYDVFGTITGRLTTKPKSFPILTLNKEHRCVIKPKNDLFVELDYNSAEIRTLLALQGLSQPKSDIHAWICKNVFNGQITREEAKQKVFAWLYNPEAKNEKLEKLFNKKEVLAKYWDGEYLETFFDRKILADERHALNYLIQSTTSDLFLRGAIKIWKLIKDRKSNVSFTIHDSLVLDYSEEDRDLLNQIVDTFSKNDLGTFKVNVSMGRNFGNMKKIN